MSLRTEGRRKLDSTPSSVYDMIVDYGSYQEWLPFVRRSKVLTREENLAIAEFYVQSPFSRWTVECVETPNQSTLIRKIGGDVPVERFVWNLEGDQETTCDVSLAIEIERDWKRFFRRKWQWLPDTILTALDTRAEILGRGAPKKSATSDLIEIVQTSRGLLLRVLGKEYLVPLAVENKDD